MMWQAFKRWLRNIEDHEVILKELNFDADGAPVSGLVDITRAGQTHRFQVLQGRVLDNPSQITPNQAGS